MSVKTSEVVSELQEIGNEVLTSLSLLHPGKQFDPNFLTTLALQVQTLRKIESCGIGPNMQQALHKLLKHEGFVE
jgi:hypothetical protein